MHIAYFSGTVYPKLPELKTIKFYYGLNIITNDR